MSYCRAMADRSVSLEVDSRSEDEFTTHDLTFLQGAANVLGMAIERERQDRSLKAALAHQEVLLKEITHRVKNSLAIVASMLQRAMRALAYPLDFNCAPQGASECA